jgi:hypothetical protein
MIALVGCFSSARAQQPAQRANLQTLADVRAHSLPRRRFKPDSLPPIRVPPRQPEVIGPFPLTALPKEIPRPDVRTSAAILPPAFLAAFTEFDDMLAAARAQVCTHDREFFFFTRIHVNF